MVSKNGIFQLYVRVLNCGSNLALETALPAPWRWYVDFEIPFESGIFTIILESTKPVISELYYSPKVRNKITFIDILNQNERSDLTIECFNGIQLVAHFPKHISTGNGTHLFLDLFLKLFLNFFGLF